MNKTEHIARHETLHRALDELVADFITHSGKMPSKATIFELMAWSSLQTKTPTAGHEEGANLQPLTHAAENGEAPLPAGA